jgi:TolB-like protein/Flp pilus assembly protein TadD
MKRCPQCNRVEADDSLAFCRTDGVALINDSPALGGDTDTAKFSSSQRSSEIETSLLPHASTTPEIVRNTGPTTVLPAPQTQATTRDLAKPKRRAFAFAAVGVALVVVLGLGYFYWSRSRTTAIESIAVLPFENRGSNSDTDYLSEGLADSLIYRLSQLPNLKVSPTSSVMKYKGQATDVGAIAKELQVDAVMSGRLMQQGEDLSISVQLIDSRNNKLIWAEQYERKMSDLLATQREIATSIAQKLQLKLAGNDTRGITKKYTDSNEAYQLYLKGRYHYAKRTREDFQKGVQYFQEAVELDPNFALAYALIADTYASMPAYPYASPNDVFPKAKAAANRAVELDPTLPEAHTALGYVLGLYDWKWDEAERAFKRALELDDKNSLVHVRFAISYYQPTGRADEAVRETMRAVELEPVNLVARANLIWVYIMAGRKAEALGQAEKLHDLEPDFVLGRYQVGLAYIANGMYKEAIALTEKPLRSDPNNQLMLQVSGFANAKLGNRAEANSVVSRFQEIRKTQYVMSFFIATIYAALGEKNKAFVELEDAYRQRDWRMSAVIKTEPMIEALRDDARYKDLLKRLNLAD